MVHHFSLLSSNSKCLPLMIKGWTANSKMVTWCQTPIRARWFKCFRLFLRIRRWWGKAMLIVFRTYRCICSSSNKTLHHRKFNKIKSFNSQGWTRKVWISYNNKPHECRKWPSRWKLLKTQSNFKDLTHRLIWMELVWRGALSKCSKKQDQMFESKNRWQIPQ